jgi:hypothetical protein
MTDRHSTQRAALARDAALRRLRRLTGTLIAGAVALSGVFAGVAASSTHTQKRAVRRPLREARSVTTTPPLPPEPSAPASAAPAQSVAPTPPAQAPAPTPEPPVVVSGGS